MSQQSTSQPYGVPHQLNSTNYVSNPHFPSIQGKNNLPPFINKLHAMVNSPDTDPWVHWNDSGTTFVVPNSEALAEQVLGRHWKHNRFPSFVRQLNMYGFHKVPHLNHGVLHDDGLPEVWEFTHEFFRRDDPDAMRYIVRKKGPAEEARSAAKHESPSSLPHDHFGDNDDIAIIRAEIHAIAARQQLIREELSRLSQSTEKLWECALDTRMRHQHQQTRLDKMVTFLSEVFRKRSAELPSKVRGLIEGPTPFEESTPFEEISDTTSVQSPLSPEVQRKVLNMIANGKFPTGLVEPNQQVQAWLPNYGAASTPGSMTSPNALDSAGMYQTYQPNAQQWHDTNPKVDNLGSLDAGNEDFSDYLAFNTDNQFPSDHHFIFSDGWLGDPITAGQTQENSQVGQKREFEDEEEIPSPKRTRF